MKNSKIKIIFEEQQNAYSQNVECETNFELFDVTCNWVTGLTDNHKHFTQK